MGETKVRVGLVAPALPVLPLWMAEDVGALERRGITLDVSVIGSTSGTTQALCDGTVDLAVGSPDSALVDPDSIVIVAGLIDRPPLSLVCQPWVTEFEDLRGQAIGTTSFQEGTVQIVQAIMAAHGMHYPEDYDFVLAGAHPQRWQALQAGELVAALQLTPFDLMAGDAGFSILAHAEDYVAGFAFSSVCARRSWATKHVELVVALADALREGETAMRERPQHAAEVAAARARISVDHARSAVDRLIGGAMPLGLVHSEEALAATRRAIDTLQGS